MDVLCDQALLATGRSEGVEGAAAEPESALPRQLDAFSVAERLLSLIPPSDQAVLLQEIPGMFSRNARGVDLTYPDLFGLSDAHGGGVEHAPLFDRLERGIEDALQHLPERQGEKEGTLRSALAFARYAAQARARYAENAALSQSPTWRKECKPHLAALRRLESLSKTAVQAVRATMVRSQENNFRESMALEQAGTFADAVIRSRKETERRVAAEEQRTNKVVYEIERRFAEDADDAAA